MGQSHCTVQHANHKLVSTIAIILGTMSTPAVFADEAMEIISINGNRYQDDSIVAGSHTGQSLTVISHDMIVEAGAVDINEILNQFVPGLYANGRNGRHTDTDYSLQGSRPVDILWLVDGNRLNNRLYGSTYTDSINPMMIERIEVIKGAQGLIYGSDAIAGVVNIITRDSRNEAAGEINLSADTLSSYDLGTWLSGGNDELNYSLSGSSSQSQGYAFWDDEEYSPVAAMDKDRGYRMMNLGGKINWRPSEQHKFTLFTQYNNGVLERPLAYSAIVSENERKQTLAWLGWNYQLSERLTLDTRVHYQNWDSYYSEVTQEADGTTALPYRDAYWGFTDKGARISAHYESAEGDTLLSGVEWQSYYGADEVMELVAPTDETQAAFVQYKPRFTALPDTALALGVRYNHLANGENKWVASLGLEQQLNQQWQLKAAVGNGFRQPTAAELWAKVGTLGNPDLESEQSINTNLTLFYQGDSTLSIEAYWRETDNLVDKREISTNVWQYANLDGKVRSQGVDVQYQVQPVKDWHLELSGSYNRSREKGQDEQIERIPEYMGFAKVAWDASNSVNLWLQGRYIGEFTDYDMKAGDYVVTSLGVQWWLSNSQDQQLTLRVDNLFDSDNTSSIFKHGHKAEYPIPTLGAPRTAQLIYRYLF
ncbi:TonB-dependent receptor plug domain-containing protein [Shewanella sp. YIC-542]|uniref:TonB-dependent receptor plug domain-containing protein n=1 Tax=Shewanella mytili TaxID=3377111 RepID=UPI00398E9C3D